MKRKKKAHKKEIVTIPYEIDLNRLDGQIISRGIVKNSSVVQGLIFSYRLYINGILAYSPWMSIKEGDVIEVFTQDDTKNSWIVGSDNLDTKYNVPRPRVNSLFGLGGISLESVERY